MYTATAWPISEGLNEVPGGLALEVFCRSSKRPLENVKVFSKSLLGYVEAFWRSSKRPWKM
jgi:hypothetical protein